MMTSILPLSLFPSTRRFRLPSRKKPLTAQQQHQHSSSPFDALPIELLAKILDYFHTKEVKLSLALVNSNFALASKRCTHLYAIGPSFSPMNSLLREMQIEEIGCLSSKAMYTTKQQFFANRKLEGVVVVVVGRDLSVLLKQHKMNDTLMAYRVAGEEVVASGVDMFGRAYERTAKLQLVCTALEKHENRWIFCKSLPNLPKQGNSTVYAELQAVIAWMVPKMEPTVAYAKRLAPSKLVKSGLQLLTANIMGKCPVLLGEEMEPLRRYDLQSKSQLQVYMQMEDIELEPGDTLKCTAWQVAGLPQEHIVCTAEYYLQRDDALLEGGAREFKRGMLVGEAARVELAAQWPRIGSVFPDGLVSLGQQPVKQGMLMVFPNTHVSRTAALTNTSKTQIAKQRKLTVWLVDPDVTDVAACHNNASLASWQQVAQERSKLRQNWNTFQLYMAAPQHHAAGGGGFYM